MVVVFAVGTGAFLHGQEAYEPPGPSAGLDLQRSQVYLSGTGYNIDKQQEKTNKKAEKEKEEEEKEKNNENKQETKPPRPRTNNPVEKIVRNNRSAAKTRGDSGKSTGNVSGNKKNGATEKSKSSGNGSGSNGKGYSDKSKDPTKPGGDDSGGNPPNTPGGNDEDDGLSEEERAKKPRIGISIASGQHVGGKRGNFTVKVTDYKGRNVPVFSEDDGSFAAFFNGEQLVSMGRSGNETAFRAELAHGENEIYVSAVDREGNTNERRVRFIGDTSVDAEVIGKIYVAVEAPIIHLGTICDAVIDLHPGDTARDALEEVLKQAGITPYFSGSYLNGIGRSGIAQGAYIDDETRAYMEELRKTEKDPDKQDKNKLKEHDFYDSSGWIYCVNDEFPEMGLSSYRMEDEDELYLIFQLATDVY